MIQGIWRAQSLPLSIEIRQGEAIAALAHDERNRSTPAVRLKGHSAKLPSGLLAFLDPDMAHCPEFAIQRV